MTASSLRRRLAIGGAWSTAGRLLTAASTLAINALLARMLGADELGAYFLLLTVTSMATFGTRLGLGQTTVRLVSAALAGGEPGRAQAIALWVLALGGALGGALALAFGPGGGGDWLGRAVFDSPAMAAGAAVGSLWLLALVLQTALAEAWRGYGDIRHATLFGGAATGVLAASAVAVCWTFGLRPALSFILLLLAAAAALSVAAGGWLLARRIRGCRGPGTAGATEIIRAAGPLLLAGLPWLVFSHADIVILGVFREPAEVARYATAARLVALVTMPLLIVNAVLPPVIAELYAKGELRRLERTLRATATLAGLPPVAALAVFGLSGDTILGVVYGDAYRAGATVLAILSVGQLITVWSGSCGLTLMQTGQNASVLAITLVGAVTVVGLGLALVGPYGAEGAAVATTAGLAVLNVGFWLAVRRRTGIWTHVRLAHVLHPRAGLELR